MKKKVFIGIFIFLCITATALILRPVPIVTEDEALIVTGIVQDVYEGGTKDIVFRLKNDNSIYYINRGLERGLEIKSLKKKLLGNKAVFKYPKHHWIPLDWNNRSKHISKVEIRDEIVFNELNHPALKIQGLLN